MKTILPPTAECDETIIHRSSFIVHRSTSVVQRSAFTLVELLVVIAIIGILIAILLPAIQASRESANRTACMNKLAQLSVAAQNYEMAHEAFPAGITDTQGPIRSVAKGNHHGWIIQLLPYMEETSAYRNIDQKVSVYAPANAPVMATQLAALVCPSEPGNYGFAGPNSTPLGQSSYAGVHHDVEAPIDTDNHGMLFLNSKIRYHDIADGAKHTLLLGERRYDDADLGWLSGTRATLRNTGRALNAGLPKATPWVMPVDPNAIPEEEPIAPPPAEPGAEGEGVAAETNQPEPPGEVPAPPAVGDTNEQVAKEAPKAEPMPKPAETPPADAAAPSDPALFVGGFDSSHPGGVNFVFADGSVRFIPDTIELLILQQLAHRADGKLPPAEY